MTVISPASMDDLQSLTNIEQQLFTTDQISERQFKYLLTKANCIVVKAEKEGVFLGYMVLLKRRNSRRLRIYSLAVAPDARNRGVAGSFLSYAENVVMRQHHYNLLTLEVEEQNCDAIRLYKNAGFALYGRRPGYYEDGSTALLFRKKISSSETTQ